ncbi:MAG: hypothetical protein GT597_13845 [Bacteroidales bacterium]|jgi:ribosomal protein L44E|nr:hypothetical protein [Bacteroidales bacterium]
MKERTEYCPYCEEVTKQELAEYDPDQPGLLLVWECKNCHEQVDIAFE